MRLRTFHAADMQAAMQMVREALGEDAVILTTKRIPGGRGVAVTAAQESEDEEYAPHAQEETGEEAPQPARKAAVSGVPDYLVRDIERSLRYHGVADALLEKLLADIRYQPRPRNEDETGMRALLTGSLTRQCRFAPLPFLDHGVRMILIGPPGAGKTLTVAKIAARIVKEGGRARVFTTDHKRAGGTEQLGAFTEILNIPLETAASRKELKALLAESDKSVPVLIDSAGANPYEFQELRELAEFAGLMELTPVLVFPAGGDPAEAAEIASAFSFLGVEHMIVTRLDLARRYGSLLTASDAAGIGIAHLTGTPKVLGNFDDATPEYLAGLLMRHREE